MSNPENLRDAQSQSRPESEPVLVVRSNAGQHDSKQDEGTIRTASEPVASFTMKCSKTKQGQ